MSVKRKTCRVGLKKGGTGSLCSLALQGFISGLRNMAAPIEGHAMSGGVRVKTLLNSAFSKAGMAGVVGDGSLER